MFRWMNTTDFLWVLFREKWMKLPQSVVMDECYRCTATIWIERAPSKSTPMIMIAMSTTLPI
jgi:hypothetical protein